MAKVITKHVSSRLLLKTDEILLLNTSKLTLQDLILHWIRVSE